MATILVTGSNGQLGSELKELAATLPGMDFRFTSRQELAIDDESQLEALFAEIKPSFVINCAAYTAVDKAESEKEEALRINATAVGYLATVCKQHGAKLIHVSTDYVFNGENDRPWREDDPVSPVNFYGESKLRGEQLALSANPDSIIIRTSWVYSYHGKNFVKTMIRLMMDKDEINVVADQFGSPTYAADLARAIVTMIQSGNWLPGIYHYSNEGNISWAEFADEIKKQINSSCKVNHITTQQYPTPAKRPSYSVMDTSKIRSAYGVETTPWKVGLHACIQKLQSNISFH